MKKLLAALTSIGILASFDYHHAPDAKPPKEVIEELKKLKFVQGGTFIMGKGQDRLSAPADDTLLLLNEAERRVTTSSFWMGEKEVSNKEWRRFHRAKVQELGAEAAKAFLPDTSVWVKEFPYAHNEPMSQYYYSHPAYDEFPVVGITWQQTQAYCQWLTNYINGLLEKTGNNQRIPAFRLPTEAEWEYAAQGLTQLAGTAYNDENLPYRIFPWDSYMLWDEKGNYRANWGSVRDEYGFEYKNYLQDEAVFTAAVGSYLPNAWGLYNMAGNVREWVQDVAWMPAVALREIDEKPSLSDVLRTMDEEKISHWVATHLDHPSTGHIYHLTQILLRDARIIYGSGQQKRIAKGGGWCDPAAYLMCSSRIAMPEDKPSCTTGFRVAMIQVEKWEEGKLPKTPLMIPK